MGISVAKGKYLLFLDPDDYLAPNFLSLAIPYMESHSDCTIFFPLKYTFDSQTRKQLPNTSGYYSTYRNLLLYGQWITALIRREDCLNVGGFDESLTACEDWEFCIRLLKGERPVYKSDKALYYYRVNGNPNALTHVGAKNLDFNTTYIYRKHIDVYQKYFGNQLFNLRKLENLFWADRRLPQLVHKLQLAYQKMVTHFI